MSALAGLALPFLPLALAGDPGTPAKAEDAWTTGYYVRPVVGYNVYATSRGTSQAVSLGADAGITFDRREWSGVVRTRGVWISSSGGGEGLDLRVGSSWGPVVRYGGVTAGADLFWNRYEVDDYEVLEPSAGIEFPVRARLGPREIHALAGVSTALLAAESRRVDWSRTDAFGFGHEFEWSVGAGASLGGIGLAAVWSHRTVATGTWSGWGVGADVRL